MFDPSTVAHEIRSPFKRKSELWPKGYRAPLVTIWHEDPLNFENKCGCRRDDSCGWHTPPYTPADRERVKKLAASQYTQIFARQHYTAKGESFAHVAFQPDCLAPIFWSWRAIDHEFRKRGVWQYHARISMKEWLVIYDLATCPVDNLQCTFDQVKDLATFEDLFFCVYRAWLRHQRPWYRHPRWHFWHWRFQVHPWQTFRRWLLTRCAGCGKRFAWGESPVSHSWDSPKPKFLQGEEGLYHSDCSGRAMVLKREPPAGNA